MCMCIVVCVLLFQVPVTVITCIQATHVACLLMPALMHGHKGFKIALHAPSTCASQARPRTISRRMSPENDWRYPSKSSHPQDKSAEPSARKMNQVPIHIYAMNGMNSCFGLQMAAIGAELVQASLVCCACQFMNAAG